MDEQERHNVKEPVEVERNVTFETVDTKSKTLGKWPALLLTLVITIVIGVVAYGVFHG